QVTYSLSAMPSEFFLDYALYQLPVLKRQKRGKQPMRLAEVWITWQHSRRSASTWKHSADVRICK
ncbi:MAG TPA: hypothetical protein VF678_07785, partial [bacterium]